MSDELVIELGSAYAQVQIDDGSYPAVLVDIEPFEFTDKKTDEVIPKYRWTFALDDMDENVTVQGVTSRFVGPTSKFYKWMGALLGAPRMAEGGAIRKADWLNKPCLIEVKFHEGRERSEVISVMAPRKRRAAA